MARSLTPHGKPTPSPSWWLSVARPADWGVAGPVAVLRRSGRDRPGHL